MNNVESALSYLDPNLPRDEWAIVLMSIKSELGDDGFTIADNWSRQGINYSPADFKATWKSIKPTGGVTIATLMKKARDNGFSPNYLEPFQRPSEAERLARQRQAEIAEQQAIEQRIQSVANYWKTLQAKHPPQPCLSHPYLARKGIKPHGVSYLPCGADGVLGNAPFKDHFTKDHGDNPLILWMMREGRLSGFQFIYADGYKRFLAGTVKQGGYYMVTRFDQAQTEQADKVILCEGFATACSVIEHRYPDAIAYIAFDAGNLPHVSPYLRRLYPDKNIIICADNDHHTARLTGNNPGIDYAKKAVWVANGYNGVETSIEAPTFENFANADDLSDWNDYYTFRDKPC